MLNIQLQLKPQTEERLKKVLAFYQDQEIFAENLIAYQIAELKKGILNIRLDLMQFEEQYQLSTAEFYRKFSEGIFGDEDDFMIWAGIYELYLKTKEEIELSRQEIQRGETLTHDEIWDMVLSTKEPTTD